MSFPGCSTIGIQQFKGFPARSTKPSFSQAPLPSAFAVMDPLHSSSNFSPLHFPPEMEWNAFTDAPQTRNTTSLYLTPEDIVSHCLSIPSTPANFVSDVTECGLVQSGSGASDTITFFDRSSQLSTDVFVAFPASNHALDVEQCDSTQTSYPCNSGAPVTTPSLPDRQSCDCVNAISTQFSPGFEFSGITSDMQIVSWDSVLFHVHRGRLLEASSNGFNALLYGAKTRIVVPENSDLLNIILHAIYGISCSPFQHSVATLMDAVNLFPRYGVKAKDYISPSLPLFNDIRYQMPLSPLLTFVVASSHELEDLAVLASAHLLALDISTMSDEMVEVINPVYLKRLFDLQTSRVNAFKRLLAVPPESHPATSKCDFIAQKALTRSWAFYTAYMLWDARADMTAGTIERTFQTLECDILCDLCTDCLKKRVKSIVVEWSELKRTI
ncbi:hypothetical protein IW261DRAFT_1558359 [Armillaria novae-zelandiae]|uniref:Uncharacterized protein n=1 Tax=Armillaria novae-zelandiae TaxID=153914 RepID=A0AA39PMX2_9AGAR|nr:hypothetical protein IW261DRAFT_1558359 [Armillaria novae-zelandiae]